jgi:hypothetical protein
MASSRTVSPTLDAPRARQQELRAAVHPLVRLLARQAAREDYQGSLEAKPAKPYSKGLIEED